MFYSYFYSLCIKNIKFCLDILLQSAYICTVVRFGKSRIAHKTAAKESASFANPIQIRDKYKPTFLHCQTKEAKKQWCADLPVRVERIFGIAIATAPEA